MVGGPPAVFERVKPLFELMGKNITLIGGNGDGQTCKVANQIVVALTIEAVAEALVFASKAGADPAKVRQALMGGFASSRILEVHGERMIKRTFDPGFRIELHQKDLNLVLSGARALGVSLPNTATAQELFNACARTAAPSGTTRRWSRRWRSSPTTPSGARGWGLGLGARVRVSPPGLPAPSPSPVRVPSRLESRAPSPTPSPQPPAFCPRNRTSPVSQGAQRHASRLLSLAANGSRNRRPNAQSDSERRAPGPAGVLPQDDRRPVSKSGPTHAPTRRPRHQR